MKKQVGRGAGLLRGWKSATAVPDRGRSVSIGTDTWMCTVDDWRSAADDGQRKGGGADRSCQSGVGKLGGIDQQGARRSMGSSGGAGAQEQWLNVETDIGIELIAGLPRADSCKRSWRRQSTRRRKQCEDTLLVPVARHPKTLCAVGVVLFKTNLTRFCGTHQRLHSPLAYVDGEWGQERWRTRRGGFFTDLDGTLLLEDQWRQDDGPVEKVKEDRIGFRGDFYTHCIETSGHRRDKALPAEGVAAVGRGGSVAFARAAV